MRAGRLIAAATAIAAAIAFGACGSHGDRSSSTSAGAGSPTGLRAQLAPWRLPVPVAAGVALAQPGRLLMIGGLDSSGASSDQVLAIDPRTGAGRDQGTLMQPTHDAAGAVIGGRAFVFGGGESISYSGVEELPPGRPAALIGSLPTARSDLAATTIGRRAYLLGGYDGATLASDVLTTGDGRGFRTIARLRDPVRYPAAAAAGGRLFAFGGELASGSATDAIQEVNPKTGLTKFVASLPAPTDHAAAISFGDRIFVLGGNVAGVPSRQVVSFDPATGRVAPLSQLPLAIADAAAVRSGATGYLLGGLDARGAPSDRVIRLTPSG